MKGVGKAIFDLKNHETIHTQVRGAHLLWFGVFDPPLAPPQKKTYFYEKAQNMLKFEKVGFLGVKRGVFGFEPPKTSLYMIIYFFGGLEAKKCHWGSPSEKISPKMVPKG